jgi:hypothetical protein
MIAGGNSDALWRADRLQPVVGSVDLGIEAQVHQVACNRDKVGLLRLHVVDELDQTFTIEGFLPLDLPVQEASDPLAEQIAESYWGQGRQMNVGDVGESDHLAGVCHEASGRKMADVAERLRVCASLC